MTPALRSAPPVGVWPDFIAPPKYENPCEDWEDPRLPDFRLIWETARPLGYAIGLHGSMKRDCDLIAAPWVDNPAHPDDLIKALCVALNATQVGGVEAKPVGRIAVILQIDGYVKHIDLSIMPAPPVGARVTWGLILYGLSTLIGITATAFVAGAMVTGIVVWAWGTK